ncbi:MAG: hypothetical protein KDK55_05275 [Chlamydiia bacterium]|nr:hypothetical protein [Chlamydiia bacterium]
MFLNTLNLLGYAPLVGVLPAAIRWGAAYHTWDQKNIRSLNYGMIARGTLEILGAGSLLIIPDLIVSIERHLRSGNPTQLI